MKVLLEKLKQEKGRIVSTASLSEYEIALAGVQNRMWVDDEGFGFVWLPEDYVNVTKGFIHIEENYIGLFQKPGDRIMEENLRPVEIIGLGKLTKKINP